VPTPTVATVTADTAVDSGAVFSAVPYAIAPSSIAASCAFFVAVAEHGGVPGGLPAPVAEQARGGRPAGRQLLQRRLCRDEVLGQVRLW
jgi:hypothetical protein